MRLILLKIDNILDVSKPAFRERDTVRKGEVLTRYEYIWRQKNEHVRTFVNRYKRIERECKEVGVNYAEMLDGETRGQRLLLSLGLYFPAKAYETYLPLQGRPTTLVELKMR